MLLNEENWYSIGPTITTEKEKFRPEIKAHIIPILTSDGVQKVFFYGERIDQSPCAIRMPRVCGCILTIVTSPSSPSS